MKKHPLIKEKMRVFEELEIPWDVEIERQFNDEIKKGNKHADVFLDNLCHDYMVYFYDHYTEIMLHQLYKKHHKGDTLYEYAIEKEIGAYAAKEIIDAGAVEYAGSYNGSKLYTI